MYVYKAWMSYCNKTIYSYAANGAHSCRLKITRDIPIIHGKMIYGRAEEIKHNLTVVMGISRIPNVCSFIDKHILLVARAFKLLYL